MGKLLHLMCLHFMALVKMASHMTEKALALQCLAILEVVEGWCEAWEGCLYHLTCVRPFSDNERFTSACGRQSVWDKVLWIYIYASCGLVGTLMCVPQRLHTWSEVYCCLGNGSGWLSLTANWCLCCLLVGFESSSFGRNVSGHYMYFLWEIGFK